MTFFAFLIASFTSLLSIANPFAAMPFFLAMTDGDTDEHRRQQALKASMYTLLILMIFLFGGNYIISFFGISLEGIRIAGGLLIMKMAYSMLDPDSQGRKLNAADHSEAYRKPDISFSPLAMPMLAGPGSIALVLGLASQSSSVFDYAGVALAILLVALTSFGLLVISRKLTRMMGKTGMTALTRMMGFIALTIGVQFIINGVRPIIGS
ncbi:MarC family NAAT transporter [Balneolales bacterium ANBcel1]|nr:MarC family NAAT transporter [Balneolales bacterium ANBcel1]